MLKRFIPALDVSAVEIADMLTMKSYEVEEVVALNEGLENVVIGRIDAISAHPNADRLRLTKVDVGATRLLEIVCGASNIEVGQKIPVAMIGASLPNGLTIQKTKIRGEISEGMLCSETELGLGEGHSGILILDADAPVGKLLDDYLGRGDSLIDINNKGMGLRASDSMSVFGVAREVARLLDMPLQSMELAELGDGLDKRIILDESICKFYSLTHLTDVADLTPEVYMKTFLQQLDAETGIGLVDLGNFVMYETGQPLHIFDADKIEGETIEVRRAKQGEEFVSLEGEKMLLEEGDIVICDSVKIVALAGIKGAQNSCVDENTKSILVESANFDADQVRTTARRLKLLSDASKRFERKIPVELALMGIGRLVYYAIDHGAEMQGIAKAGSGESPKQTVHLEYDYVNRYLGTALDMVEIDGILMGSDCVLRNKDEVRVEVEIPYYRLDLGSSEDLIDEIGRLYGYENIKGRLDFETRYPKHDELYEFAMHVKGAMYVQGFTEILTYPYDNEGYFEMMNSVDKERNFLRKSLASGMCQALGKNQLLRDKVQLFEVNTVFEKYGEGLNLSVGMYEKGKSVELVWSDLYGCLQTLLWQMGINNEYLSWKLTDKREGQEEMAEIFYGEHLVGYIKGEVLEVSLSQIKDFRVLVDIAYQELPKYPTVKRDLTVEVKKLDKTCQEVVDFGRQHMGELCRSLEFVGKYETDKTKKVTLHLEYGANDRSLLDEEVNEQVEELESILKKHF
jgi:phenylalanyl-tRNA synthetase beta chain